MSLQFEERILKEFSIKQIINFYGRKYWIINCRNIMLLGSFRNNKNINKM